MMGLPFLGTACQNPRRLLTLTDNYLAGYLPDAWGSATAFPRLTILALNGNNVSGPYPAAWASAASFPAMRGAGKGMCAHRL